MSGTPLIMGEKQRAELAKLRELAAAHPVDVAALQPRLETPAGKALHMDQMERQTVEIPMGYLVTFSIESGHPCGVVRHMSMSSPAKGRVPNEPAVWMIAEELGFTGGFSDCVIWLEDLQRGNGRAQAVNVVQPLAVEGRQSFI